MIKTNVMRILDEHKIEYKTHFYEVDLEHLDAIHAANALNEALDQVFKTIITTYDHKYFVCVINASDSIDLKKAAKVFDVKSLELAPINYLTKITGVYVRGGCSPIGMKKQFPTVIDLRAFLKDTIVYSAGKRGAQVETKPEDLMNLIGAYKADIRK